MPMRPSVVLDMKRSAVREAVTRFRTTNPRVFGSVLHGTDRDGSDLDLLVDALPGATLLDLGGLQDDLELLLGVHVDLPRFARKAPSKRFGCVATFRRSRRVWAGMDSADAAGVLWAVKLAFAVVRCTVERSQLALHRMKRRNNLATKARLSGSDARCLVVPCAEGGWKPL